MLSEDASRENSLILERKMFVYVCIDLESVESVLNQGTIGCISHRGTLVGIHPTSP